MSTWLILWPPTSHTYQLLTTFLLVLGSGSSRGRWNVCNIWGQKHMCSSKQVDFVCPTLNFDSSLKIRGCLPASYPQKDLSFNRHIYGQDGILVHVYLAAACFCSTIMIDHARRNESMHQYNTQHAQQVLNNTVTTCMCMLPTELSRGGC